MHSDREAILRFDDFSLDIRSGSRWHKILNAISFKLHKSESLALVGESGAGKTMILRSVIGMFDTISEYRTEGAVFLAAAKKEYNIYDLKHDDLLKIRANKIAWIMQSSAQVLNPSYTVYQELQNSIHYGNTQKSNDELIDLLRYLGFDTPEDIMRKYPHELSGGQIQRILIASALVRDAQILLIDEPSSNLDPELKKEIMDLIFKLKEEFALSLILVSHDLELVTNYCDTIAVVKDSKILEIGSARKIIESPEHPYTRSLLSKRKASDSEHKISSETILELKNVSFHYPSSKWTLFSSKEKNWVLKDFDLAIRSNEIISLIGASGSGKSTLAKLLTGLLQSTEGEVLFRGKDIMNYSRMEFSEFRTKVQIIFQDALSSIAPHFSSYQLLKEIASIHKKALNREDCITYLSEFGLAADILDKRVSEMSGGQRQRLLIARSLIAKPEVLICDEITSSLDTIVKRQIIGLLLDIKKSRELTLVFVSHDHSLVESISDRIIHLNTRN